MVAGREITVHSHIFSMMGSLGSSFNLTPLHFIELWEEDSPKVWGRVSVSRYDDLDLRRLNGTFSSIWQVHLSVSQVSVSLSVDCQHVGERPARPLGNLPTDGFEMLGKLVKTRGPNSGSAPVFNVLWY